MSLGRLGDGPGPGTLWEPPKRGKDVLEQGGSRLQESEERKDSCHQPRAQGPLGRGQAGKDALLPGLQGGPAVPRAMDTTVPWPRLQGALPPPPA